MLSKQSIRSNVSILLNEETTTKDHLIELSKGWSENEEILFRKMLKQGGDFRIQGQKFKMSIEENTTLNSRGNFDAPIRPIDIKGDNVDPNYIRR